MLQVQKGQVKYKDRSDIICTYGTTEDGKQYYFLDGEKLGNGRIVASTALVEAIDPLVMASHIGVIDSDGREIIPFENRAVKPISDQAILVEISTPVTPSVIEAVNMRKDPLAATRLVTTPAAIKEKINAKMGAGGRFVFNDQFSEASVYDLDGNNLLDNKLYSFVGYNNGNLYLAQNTADTDVLVYSLNKQEEEKSAEAEDLDVKEISVDQGEIDEAMASESNDENILHPVEFKETIPVPEENDFPDDVALDEDKSFEQKIDEKELDKSDSAKDDEEEEKVGEEEKEDKEEAEQSDSDDDKITIPSIEPKISLFKHAPIVKEDVEEENETSKHAFDSKQTMFRNDRDIDSVTDDSIIEDTAEVMSELIKQNKEQKEVINNQQEQMDSLLKFKKKAFEENRMLVEINETLKKEIRNLKREVTDTNEQITKLEEEISKLRAQVSGKNDLARLIADAKDLLNNDSNM